MATLTIRNLDDEVVAALKARAKANNRSLEAEVRQLLLRSTKPLAPEEMVLLAESIAAMTPKDIPQTDSVELLREDRDR